MIAQGVTATLYLHTRNSREQRHAAATATKNNNNGGAKNLNPKRSHPANTRPREEDTKASWGHGGATWESYFGHKASERPKPPGIRFSWPQFSHESLPSVPWPDCDWKAHMQRSVEWIRSVDWKPDWPKGRTLEEALSASRAWGNEWLKGTDSLEMPRIPFGDWLGFRDRVLEGTIMPPRPMPPPPPQRRRR